MHPGAPLRSGYYEAITQVPLLYPRAELADGQVKLLGIQFASQTARRRLQQGRRMNITHGHPVTPNFPDIGTFFLQGRIQQDGAPAGDLKPIQNQLTKPRVTSAGQLRGLPDQGRWGCDGLIRLFGSESFHRTLQLRGWVRPTEPLPWFELPLLARLQVYATTR